MNFCPKCGKPVEKGAKFCTHCGYQLDSHGANQNDFKSNFTDKFQELKSKINTSWFKDPKHKKYAGIAVIVVLILFCLGRISRNGGSLTAPKTISFAKQSKAMGTHVWLYSYGDTKDSEVEYIDILKNGKFKQYQIFDSNITLGKVSNMSNHQLISLGKKQDKKYFDESANEVRAFRDGKDQIGLQNDLMGDKYNKGMLRSGANLYAYGDRKDGDNEETIVYKRLISSDEYEQHDGDDRFYHYFQNAEMGSAYGDTGKEITRLRCNALIKHINETKYLAPKWQKLTFSNKTDDTGNKIVEQKFNYKSIDEYSDFSKMNDNVLKLSPSEKSKILDYMNYTGKPDHELLQDKIDKAGLKAFNENYQYKITSGIFKPNTFNDYIKIEAPISQQIYKTRYIGYVVDDGETYLLTKAQTKNQKAVISKP